MSNALKNYSHRSKSSFLFWSEDGNELSACASLIRYVLSFKTIEKRPVKISVKLHDWTSRPIIVSRDAIALTKWTEISPGKLFTDLRRELFSAQ